MGYCDEHNIVYKITYLLKNPVAIPCISHGFVFELALVPHFVLDYWLDTSFSGLS